MRSDAHSAASPAAPDSVAAASEADLLRRLKAGEESAYEELVRALTGRLLAVARRVSRTDADAEDAVQEAFISAFKAIRDFDGRSTLSTWLHRVVVNAALMRARRDARRRESSIDALLPQFVGGEHKEHPVRWRDVTPGSAAGIEESAMLWSALDQLPDEFRTVIVLKDIEGMESKAIAASLDISDSLVRQRLHRGRQALMRLLAGVMTEAST